MGSYANLFSGLNKVGQSANTFASSYAEANAKQMQSNYEASVAEQNARLSEFAAADARKRGEVAANKIRSQGERVAGTQASEYAAGNVDVSTGSAAEVQAETRHLTALDEITARNNAAREAWGYEVEGMTYGSKAAFARLSGQNAYENTLLTGAGKAIAGATGAAFDFSKLRVPSSTKTETTTPDRGSVFDKAVYG